MKILVISSNLIGDSVLSTGVVEHFAKIYPKAKFTFVIGPSAGQIYKNFPSKEKIILIQKKKFNRHWLEIFFATFSLKWEVVIDLRSSLISYLLFKKKNYIFKKNKSLNHLDQLKEVFNLSSSKLYIHTTIEEEFVVKNNLNTNLKHIIIFPGGNWNPKIWPIDNYNKLINILIKKFSNLNFILVGSNKEKDIYFKAIKKDLPDNIFLDLMGKSLTLTSAYMKKSNLFIGNDSGLMHLAVASNLKTISLFGPTNDKIYGHSNENSYIIRTKKSFEEFNSMKIDPLQSYMTTINPEQILELILLKKLL